MRRLRYAQTTTVFGDFLALFAVIAILTFKLHATAQQVTGVQIAYMLPIAILRNRLPLRKRPLRRRTPELARPETRPASKEIAISRPTRTLERISDSPH
jgi:hypothetical protein